MGSHNHDRFACDQRFPGRQVIRLLRAAVAHRHLDLTGLRVLTEASVGYRRAAPVLAALAGADAVYAVGRDSVEAARRDAEEQTMWLADLSGVSDRVHLLPTRLQAPLATVDVVTDLPGVRPVDEAIVRNLADTAVVTLMRGVGSWRAAHVDVATCRRGGVAVAGVDEDAIGLYRHAAMEALYGLLTLGVQPSRATVVVAGSGPAYAHVVQALSRLGARVRVAAPETPGRIQLYGGEKSGDGLGDEAVLGRLAEADALLLCPEGPDERWIAPAGPVDAARLAAAAPHLAVVGQGADADLRALSGAGLRSWPAGGRDAGPASLADLLPGPMIDLYAAGLKVAEVMARARRRGSSPLAAEQLAADEAHAELLPKDLAGGRQ